MDATATGRARLPKPPAEVPCVCSLTPCAPKFAAAVVRVQDRMVARGLARPKVVESLRTAARQDYLYAFGRDYDDGRGIVTERDSSDPSWHMGGVAVDMVHPTLEWDAPASYFRALGECAQAEGLRWGGDWHGDGSHAAPIDLPHVQWGAPMRVFPSAHGAALIAAGDFATLWREVGAA